MLQFRWDGSMGQMSSVFDFYFLSILGEENPGREKSGGIG